MSPKAHSAICRYQAAAAHQLDMHEALRLRLYVPSSLIGGTASREILPDQQEIATKRKQLAPTLAALLSAPPPNEIPPSGNRMLAVR